MEGITQVANLINALCTLVMLALTLRQQRKT